MQRLMAGCLAAVLLGGMLARAETPRALVYTHNGLTADGKKGFVHDNIAASVKALQEIAKDNGFALDVSDDPKVFTDENLKQYRAVIFDNSNTITEFVNMSLAIV